MWRFRFSLTSDRRALTKFLKCVDWSDASEARQAAELMQQWAPIEIADALELLSPDFSNQEVSLRDLLKIFGFSPALPPIHLSATFCLQGLTDEWSCCLPSCCLQSRPARWLVTVSKILLVKLWTYSRGCSCRPGL